MASHGQDETARLKANLDDQLQRLLTQLDDLEELREELEDDEYQEVRVDTLEQLEELREQMDSFSKGNATLVSQLGAMRLAIEATIKSEARTPEIIRMFAAKQAPSLRQRFRELKEGTKLGRVSERAFKGQAAEICLALRKLGEDLTDEEEAVLRAHDSTAGRFTEASAEVGEAIMGVASAQVAAAATSSHTS